MRASTHSIYTAKPTESSAADRPWKVWLILLLFTAICMSLTGSDSPFFPMDHVDSYMFYLNGSALIDGMTPYVDFSDCKGLYLWVFYGLGYLLSPTSYLGVWILSIIVLSFTFYWCYRSALLVLRQPWLSLAATFCMGVSYFICINFMETRIETLCSLPMAYAMYLLVKEILADGDGISPLSGPQAFWLGAAVAITSLAKWSIAALLGVFCLALLVLELSNRELRKSLLRKAGLFFLGLVALWLPAVIYLLARGAFSAFWQDYIWEPISLSSYTGGPADSLQRLLELFKISRLAKILFPLAALSTFVIFWRKRGVRRWIFPATFILFLGLLVIHALLHHYYQIAVIWFLPIFILIAMPFRRLKAGWQFALAILCAILTFGYAAQHTRRLMSDDALLSPLDVVPEVNSKVLADWDKPERPRMLYVYLLGYDLGRELDPLPVGRYWFSQNYIGNFHLAEQYRYIEERQPDYVFTIEPEKDAHFSPEYEFGRVKRLLKDSGYNLIYTSPVIGGTIHLLVFRKTDTFPFPPGK